VLIGYSHPKARYFLLLRQKKVSKEKAARLQFDLRASVSEIVNVVVASAVKTYATFLA
jgi:hypothetical protein